MNRADITQALPQLCPQKVEAVLERLKELGCTDRKSIQYLQEADLTEGGILKLLEARRLIGTWKQFDDQSGANTVLDLLHDCKSAVEDFTCCMITSCTSVHKDT